MDNSIAIDSGLSAFQADVIDASAEQLVLVDFWAAWCGPCRNLGPILEKVVAEYQGSVRLVKVDTDREQALAGQFGIRSLPTVLFFRDGRVVDQFLGAQPEGAVREMIDRHTTSPFERALAEARELYAQGETATAHEIVEQLMAAQPDNDEPKLALIEWLSAEGDLDAARELVDRLSPAGRVSPAFRAFQANLEFRQAASELPGKSELEARITETPDDLAARYQLAQLLVNGEDHAGAMDQLLEIIRRDRGFEDDGARKMMLKIFEMLGGRGELVSEYRTRLSRTLF